MTEVVIDTNVLLVAEGMHADVSDECVAACSQRLGLVMKTTTVVIDDNYRVLGEYQNKLREGLNKPSPPHARSTICRTGIETWRKVAKISPRKPLFAAFRLQ